MCHSDAPLLIIAGAGSGKTQTWSGSSASAVHPLRFFIRQQSRYDDKHVYTPRTRFLPSESLDLFTCESPPPPFAATVPANRQTAPPAVDMVAALSSMWQ